MAYVNKGPILVDQSIKLSSNLKPVIIPDTADTDQLQYPEKAEKEGIRSIVSLPINLRGKIIGALRIYHSEPWEVSASELAFLRLLTLNIGMALMVLLSLLPVGLAQTWASVEHGMWYARSAEFLQGSTLEFLRWMRALGDTIFGVGILGVGWFVVGLKTGWSLQDGERTPNS